MDLGLGFDVCGQVERWTLRWPGAWVRPRLRGLVSLPILHIITVSDNWKESIMGPATTCEIWNTY